MLTDVHWQRFGSSPRILRLPTKVLSQPLVLVQSLKSRGRSAGHAMEATFRTQRPRSRVRHADVIPIEFCYRKRLHTYTHFVEHLVSFIILSAEEMSHPHHPISGQACGAVRHRPNRSICRFDGTPPFGVALLGLFLHLDPCQNGFHFRGPLLKSPEHADGPCSPGRAGSRSNGFTDDVAHLESADSQRSL